MNKKKILSLVLTLALTVSAVTAVTAVTATADATTFLTQHAELDFNSYVIENKKNAMTDYWSIAGDETTGKYMKFHKGVEEKTLNWPVSLQFVLSDKGNVSDDPYYASYRIFQNGHYKISFDYKSSRDISVGLRYTAYTQYLVTTSQWLGADGQTADYNKSLLKLNNTSNWYSLKKTEGWESVTIEFYGPSYETGVGSLLFSLSPIAAANELDFEVNNIVLDRLASINLTDENGNKTTVYGAPACGKGNWIGTTFKNEYPGEKIAAVTTNGTTANVNAIFTDAERTAQLASDAVFPAAEGTEYYTKALVPDQTGVYENTSETNKYDIGTNAFGTGFADIKAYAANSISGASNIKSGFIIWTKKLLGENTLDINCVGDGNKAIKIETTGIDSFASLSDKLYGILLCSDSEGGKVSERYKNINYAVRPYVSYEKDGNTYYVYGDTTFSE